ncbi:dentin sialophosphoprotein-like isoform X2 [Acanthaster planci]|nr:dentin sialophosphoprotein-like isoform X2 [Acanthaster planci]
MSEMSDGISEDTSSLDTLLSKYGSSKGSVHLAQQGESSTDDYEEQGNREEYSSQFLREIRERAQILSRNAAKTRQAALQHVVNAESAKKVRGAPSVDLFVDVIKRTDISDESQTEAAAPPIDDDLAAYSSDDLLQPVVSLDSTPWGVENEDTLNTSSDYYRGLQIEPWGTSTTESCDDNDSDGSDDSDSTSEELIDSDDNDVIDGKGDMTRLTSDLKHSEPVVPPGDISEDFVFTSYAIGEKGERETLGHESPERHLQFQPESPARGLEGAEGDTGEIGHWVEDAYDEENEGDGKDEEEQLEEDRRINRVDFLSVPADVQERVSSFLDGHRVEEADDEENKGDGKDEEEQLEEDRRIDRVDFSSVPADVQERVSSFLDEMLGQEVEEAGRSEESREEDVMDSISQELSSWGEKHLVEAASRESASLEQVTKKVERSEEKRQDDDDLIDRVNQESPSQAEVASRESVEQIARSEERLEDAAGCDVKSKVGDAWVETKEQKSVGSVEHLSSLTVDDEGPAADTTCSQIALTFSLGEDTSEVVIEEKTRQENLKSLMEVEVRCANNDGLELEVLDEGNQAYLKEQQSGNSDKLGDICLHQSNSSCFTDPSNSVTKEPTFEDSQDPNQDTLHSEAGATLYKNQHPFSTSEQQPVNSKSTHSTCSDAVAEISKTVESSPGEHYTEISEHAEKSKTCSEQPWKNVPPEDKLVNVTGDKDATHKVVLVEDHSRSVKHFTTPRQQPEVRKLQASLIRDGALDQSDKLSSDERLKGPGNVRSLIARFNSQSSGSASPVESPHSDRSFEWNISTLDSRRKGRERFSSTGSNSCDADKTNVTFQLSASKPSGETTNNPQDIPWMRELRERRRQREQKTVLGQLPPNSRGESGN